MRRTDTGIENENNRHVQPWQVRWNGALVQFGTTREQAIHYLSTRINNQAQPQNDPKPKRGRPCLKRN